MLGKMSLDGTWTLKGTDGHRGSPASYCAEEVDERMFLIAQVPGEVHLDLLRQGRIADPRVGTHALAARWVEEQYWIYRRTFTAPAEALAAGKAWLVFEGLDLVADVYLNGERVGGHANAFRPCRLDVTGRLRQGENHLAVCLDAGLHAVAEKPSWEYVPDYENLLTKRMWLRKPQYQFAWDWNPRLVNVGIFRPVRLEWADLARIDQVTIYPELAADHSRATLQARLHVENMTDKPLPVTLRMTVRETGAQVERDVILQPGASSEALAVEVEKPRLWWPRPHGEQPLYRVVCEVLVNGQVADTVARRTGIRSIRINQEPHPVEGRYFTLEVNGLPIFAKGGNWVPADMLYADVDAARYRELIDLAVQANFNLLRIWGGGLYMDHTFLDLCDEAGVMVWHDLIFACSKYPAGDPDFLHNVRAEVTYVARELSPHPSLMVWCGNNELEWGTWEWGYDRGRAFPDYALYHHVFPVIMQAEDPSRPYWPSSPYSPDHQPPNAPTVGDQHPWHVSIQQNRENFWAYRGDVSRFPNEGGALGASSPATLREFLPEDERYYLSPSWEYHDNEIAQNARSLMGEEWFARWLGMRPGEMTLDDYAYYSGVLQAEALVEYIHNFRRRMFSTSSAIFWMYNDSWPVTHGWTIVDYYRRRKLAYHPVRRAFEPVQIMPVVEGSEVLVCGVNDTLQPWQGEARWGLVRFDGRDKREQVAQVELKPNAATLVGRFALADWERWGYTESCAYATLAQEGRVVRQNRLLMAAYKDIAWPQPDIDMVREGPWVVLRSPTFAWGVCLDPEGEADVTDDLFDLLPGVPWSIVWPEERPLPTVARVGNYHA
jgi:beta-mannosidase